MQFQHPYGVITTRDMAISQLGSEGLLLSRIPDPNNPSMDYFQYHIYNASYTSLVQGGDEAISLHIHKYPKDPVKFSLGNLLLFSTPLLIATLNYTF